jgi:hypothetical protein
MALTAPSPQQRQFAGQIAWERGKKIATMPTTSSALNGLIQSLLANHAPLPAMDWQIDRYRRLLAECVAKVENFDPTGFSELPADRAAANKATFALQKMLNRVEYRSAVSNADQYLVDEDSPEAAAVDVAATVVETDDIPF